MRAIVIETDLVPDALQLARRIWDRPGAMLLWSADAGGPSYLACEPDAHASALDPEPELAFGSSRPELGQWSKVPRWVGLLPYEAERSRLERPGWTPSERREQPSITEPEWWRYPAMCVVGRRVTVLGEPLAAKQLLGLLRRTAQASLDCGLRPLARESAALHIERIQRALDLIAAGDLYQVNLARRLDFEVHGTTLALLNRMAARSRPAFGAALELPSGQRVVSTSPELFLRSVAGGRIETIPIKGTRPRGRDASEDAMLREELAASAKEQAELAMVIDVERNDIGRVARVGSVCAEPPRLVMHSQVFHQEALVSGVLRARTSRTELLEATLPSGSITGAPKVRAMEVIAELESQRRGLYTGALGYLAWNGQLNLAMAIRCLTLRDSMAHYHVGGGIVADSDPRRELEETEWKAVQLAQLLG